MNKEVALMFPGQGSQYVGMGKDFYESYPEAREFFKITDGVLGFSLSSIVFEGPEERLATTSICQPAVLTVSYIAFRILMKIKRERKLPFKIRFALGHSLGEYTALISSGVIDFPSGVLLVYKRGRFMEEIQNGGMVAILGLPLEQIEEIVKEIKGVEIANVNSPGQIVIAGIDDALKEAERKAKTKGAKATVRLKVSIPSHSSYMRKAKERLREELRKIEFKKPKFPVVTNYSASPVADPIVLKESLIEQMTNRLRWDESIRNVIASGVETFIEIGPGKVLSGLVKRINREVQILRVSDVETLEETLNILNGLEE